MFWSCSTILICVTLAQISASPRSCFENSLAYDEYDEMDCTRAAGVGLQYAIWKTALERGSCPVGSLIMHNCDSVEWRHWSGNLRSTHPAAGGAADITADNGGDANFRVLSTRAAAAPRQRGSYWDSDYSCKDDVRNFWQMLLMMMMMLFWRLMIANVFGIVS